ncbi:diaminopimelate epimerase [bacterium]|nr:diaminopimelate epimerase [bacterium]
MVSFTKLQATGNDFVLIDCFKENLTDVPFDILARNICERRFGIGADGLLLLLPSKIANFKMRIFNPDGSEAEMCGNGIRCLALYAYEHNLWEEKYMEVETLAGVKRLKLILEGKKLVGVRVGMGQPLFQPESIPIKAKENPLNMSLRAGGRRWEVTCLSMGNPHCVVLVDDVDEFPVEKIGPEIEKHPLFPNRTNVEFVEVINRDELKVRVWERGVGETLACGTGACASLVATALQGLTGRAGKLHLKGGDLYVEWLENGEVYLTGPAEEVFEGQFDMKKFLKSER